LRRRLWRAWFAILAAIPCVVLVMFLFDRMTRDSGATKGVHFDDDRETCGDGSCYAVFAAGCFWCVEADFEKLHDPGILDVVSGYTGGTLEDPSYEEVSAGGTGHVEAALITYNPNSTSYEMLLTNYWRNVDPFNGGNMPSYG